MKANNILRGSELSAADGVHFVSTVTGKASITSNKKRHSFGAVGLIIALIVVFAFFFGTGNLIPSAISERLIEETDVQYADAVESKILVFQQALANGNIPASAAKILKDHNILVGFMKDDTFTEGIEHEGGLLLKTENKTIQPNDFVSEVHSDVSLYNAFNQATFQRAAYYYDEAAKEVLNKKSSRNNYTSESDFEDVMESIVGKGSDITINSISTTTVKNENGEETTDYTENGGSANSKSDAWSFVSEVTAKNTGAATESATLNSASVLNVADTISKEERSGRFFLGFMENISKMKAGEGNESKINEAMNYLFDKSESEVFDVKTGEIIKVSGTALESPSLYAVLAGKKVNPDEVVNYASDRVLRTVENKMGGANAYDSITSNVASTSSNVKGSIGRLNNGESTGNTEIVGSVTPIVSSSLVENSYETIKGIDAGEFLVEGAVNIGKDLAKMSGGTSGDEEAVLAYNRLNNTILALDAKADRLNRSPFDITSKNTFLGSIVYNMAVTWGRSWSSMFSKSITIASITSKSFASIFPITRADDAEGYLSSFGGCETYSTIGATGSAQCSEIATFDTTTLNNIFNDPEFAAFVNNNTTLSSAGNRTINNDSILAKFVLSNNKRTTPLGVMDGGILDSLEGSTSSIPFVSNILSMVKNLLGANRENKRIASGEAFVNSKNNPDWQTYKYAQRYVSLARATSALKEFADDETAYNIKFFEGSENPVIAFLNNYSQLAEK